MIFSIKSFQLNSEKICKLLQQLTECPILSQIEFNTIIKNLHGNQNIFVYMDENENILGMCSIMIEQKIIHGGKCVGHIEDLVVDKSARHNGVASKLLAHVISYGKQFNCYKLLLNCTNEVMPFYIKNGFEQKTNGMAYYIL